MMLLPVPTYESSELVRGLLELEAGIQPGHTTLKLRSRGKKQEVDVRTRSVRANETHHLLDEGRVVAIRVRDGELDDLIHKSSS